MRFTTNHWPYLRGPLYGPYIDMHPEINNYAQMQIKEVQALLHLVLKVPNGAPCFVTFPVFHMWQLCEPFPTVMGIVSKYVKCKVFLIKQQTKWTFSFSQWGWLGLSSHTKTTLNISSCNCPAIPVCLVTILLIVFTMIMSIFVVGLSSKGSFSSYQAR